MSVIVTQYILYPSSQQSINSALTADTHTPSIFHGCHKWTKRKRNYGARPMLPRPPEPPNEVCVVNHAQGMQSSVNNSTPANPQFPVNNFAPVKLRPPINCFTPTNDLDLPLANNLFPGSILPLPPGRLIPEVDTFTPTNTTTNGPNNPGHQILTPNSPMYHRPGAI